MNNTNKEKTLDERLDYLTKQFELLLAKEIERNKELQIEREQRKIEREDERKQRKIEREDDHKQWKMERDAEFERQKIALNEQKIALNEQKIALEQQKQQDAERYARDEVDRKQRRIEYEADRKQRRIEYEADRKAERQEYLREFKKLNKIIGDYGLASGREAEFNFKLALKRNHLLCGGIQFDTLKSNVQKTKKSREYDIVLVNGSYVALIEVKRTVSIDDINTLILEQALSFRSDFPEYADKKLLCFIATYVAIDSIVAMADLVGVGLLLKNGFKIKEIIPILKEF